jgi:hypothetical protein
MELNVTGGLAPSFLHGNASTNFVFMLPSASDANYNILSLIDLRYRSFMLEYVQRIGFTYLGEFCSRAKTSSHDRGSGFVASPVIPGEKGIRNNNKCTPNPNSLYYPASSAVYGSEIGT